MLPKREQSAYERVFLGIATTVTIVWSIANLVQVVSPVRQAPTSVNVIMGIVATSFFGAAVYAGRRAERNGNGKPRTGSILDEALRRGKERHDET